MSSTTAEKFLQDNVGSVCLTFYRRDDGTIVTDNCPKILKPVRAGYRLLLRLTAGFVAALFSTSSLFSLPENSTCQRSIGFVFPPNVWRPEKPSVQYLSLKQLTSGPFAMLPAEVYEEGGKLYIDEEQKVTTLKAKRSNASKQSNELESRLKRSGVCIDGWTATAAFDRAKKWTVQNNDRIAESYFKLALIIGEINRPEDSAETIRIVRQYATLLKRTKQHEKFFKLMKKEKEIRDKKKGS